MTPMSAPALASSPGEDLFVCLMLPDPTGQRDLRTWAESEARAIAQAGGVRDDEPTVDITALTLMLLAEQPHPEGFIWRYVLFPGPALPPLALEVGFREATGELSAIQPHIVGVRPDGSQHQNVAEFELNGVAGLHCLDFDVRDEWGSASDEGELWVTAAVTCRRTLAPGTLDVVIAIDTPHVDVLLAALPCLYELATGPELDSWLRAASDNS